MHINVNWPLSPAIFTRNIGWENTGLLNTNGKNISMFKSSLFNSTTNYIQCMQDNDIA